MGLEIGLTRNLTAVTSGRLTVLNNSNQSEEDHEMEEDDWDDYSLDSEQSDIESELVTDTLDC